MAKTTLEQFIETPEEMRLYQQERAIEYVTAMIGRLMKSKDVSRAELARRLNRVPGWVTQVLDGEKNKTIRTLSDLLWALGESLEFSHKPIAGVTADAARKNGRPMVVYINTVPWSTRSDLQGTQIGKTWYAKSAQK